MQIDLDVQTEYHYGVQTQNLSCVHRRQVLRLVLSSTKDFTMADQLQPQPLLSHQHIECCAGSFIYA